MKIVGIKDKTITVEASGVRKEINPGLLKHLKKGEYVLVHAGFAIEKYSNARAEEIKKLFKEMED